MVGRPCGWKEIDPATSPSRWGSSDGANGPDRDDKGTAWYSGSMEPIRRLLTAACKDWSSRPGDIGGSRVLLAAVIAKGPTRVLGLVPTTPVEVLATLLPIPRNLDSIDTIDLGCPVPPVLVPSPPLSSASVSGRWSWRCRGSSRMKVEPWPSPSDSAHSRPPCWVTIPAHKSKKSF